MTAIDAVAPWLNVYRQAAAKKAEAEELMAEARARIEEALGDDEDGTIAGQPVVRWAHVTSRRFDQKAAKALLGDQAETCYVESTSRRLRGARLWLWAWTAPPCDTSRPAAVAP